MKFSIYLNSIQRLLFLNTILVFSLSLNAQDLSKLERSAFDGLIINENAVLGICSELPYERDPRDCLKAGTDLKLCLHLNRVDPRFKRTRDNSSQYSCVNSLSSGGAEVIRELLDQSDHEDGCLARNVRAFYEDLIQSEDFRELSSKFEGDLGLPLVLNFTIDTRESVASIELDLKDPLNRDRGSDSDAKEEEAVSLLISRFSPQDTCTSLDRNTVIEKVANEFNRLAMIQSRKKFDPLDQDGYEAPKPGIYDSGRYSSPPKDSSSPSIEVERNSIRASLE